MATNAGPVVRLSMDADNVLVLASEHPDEVWDLVFLALDAAALACLADSAERGDFVVPTTVPAAQEQGLPFYAHYLGRVAVLGQRDEAPAVAARVGWCPPGMANGRNSRPPICLTGRLPRSARATGRSRGRSSP